MFKFGLNKLKSCNQLHEEVLLYSDASSEKNYCQLILISIVCLLSPLLKQQTCILPQVGGFKLVIERVVCNRLSDNLTEFWSSHDCSICLQPLSKEQVIFRGVKSHFLHCFWKSCLSNHLTFECSALDNIQIRRYYQPKDVIIFTKWLIHDLTELSSMMCGRIICHSMARSVILCHSLLSIPISL